MSLILDQVFKRTLDQILAQSHQGQPLEAWTFDDRASRKAAEEQLAAKGVSARIRSAYKPLLHAFLEEIDLEGVTAITVGYPVHANAPENRFRLEAYPLAALVGNRSIVFTPLQEDGFDYRVELVRNGITESIRVFAPNHLHVDAAGERNLSPTGWLRLAGEAGQRLETDYETLFKTGIDAIVRHDFGTTEPYFEELNIRVAYPAADERLPVGDEALSLREALHEDFYFSLLEFFLVKAGRPLGDRGAKPGQIVPEILESQGEVSIRIEARPLSTGFQEAPAQPLDDATVPLAPTQVYAELETLAGEPFEATTRSGRPVNARYIAGSDAPVMISGGQHPNEPTGIVGVLRAAKRLATLPGAHFTLSPLENPDGSALYQRLCKDNPRHMHHAARYTALGDDLEYRTPQAGPHLYEKAIRFKAEDITKAKLHINLHGYPSHEWTRPLSGYVPRNFAMWTLPKGFFLVIRYHEGWTDQAEILLDKVTRRLSALPGLLQYNARQVALYEIHAGETGFRIVNGFPCLSTVDDRHTVPVTLITEYPDETIYGDDFIAGHTAQMETVLAAYDAWQELQAPSS